MADFWEWLQAVDKLNYGAVVVIVVCVILLLCCYLEDDDDDDDFRPDEQNYD
jgi:hypothetical protein